MAKINHKKTTIDGHTFDSSTEAEYYEYLKQHNMVKNIELQPEFTLLESFEVVCRECGGNGIGMSLKTGKTIKCKRCKGEGTKQRQSWNYTADFRVTYTSGQQEVIDVKGFANERFPLVKKMFEYRYGMELVVVKKQKGEWVRK